VHPNLKKHVSLARQPKQKHKLVAWPYKFADKEGSYAKSATVNTIVCFKKGKDLPLDRVEAADPDGIPYYFVDVLCGWGYARILVNRPDTYYLAFSNGDFYVAPIKKAVQDLGVGDQKIVNAAIRKFRKHLRRGTKAWGCPYCNKTGVPLYEDEYVCRQNGGPCA